MTSNIAQMGCLKCWKLLEGSPTIVELYICLYYELWMNEWWYFDSLQLTVIILTVFLCILYRRRIPSVLVSISILTLLQNCRKPWFFLQSLLFGRNVHKETVGGTNSRAGGRPRRINPRVAELHADQNLRSYDDLSHNMQMWFVKLLWYLCLN